MAGTRMPPSDGQHLYKREGAVEACALGKFAPSTFERSELALAIHHVGLYHVSYTHHRGPIQVKEFQLPMFSRELS